MPKKKPDPTNPPDPPPAPPPGPEPTPPLPEPTLPVAPPKPAPGPTVARVGPGTPVRSIGDLPLATWREVLTSAGSPMLAEVGGIISAARPHGAMCLAQAYKESSLGKDATAQRTKNPYGIMEFGNRPCERVFGGQLCLRIFDSWADATETYARIISDSDPPYDPESITLEEYLAVYVGGPGCRSSHGGGCANGETWKPGGSASAGSINLYIWQVVDRINGWLKGITPAPPPVRDPLSVIVGGPVPPIDYGWLADVGLNYYGYGVNHGTNRSTQHTGLDIPLSCGTSLYTPADGVVDCVGNAGTPRWGQGCGAYADVDGGGVGNLTILLDTQYQGSPVKLTLGHVHQAFARPGDRVAAGQKVATIGSMNGCHVHVETSINRNGTYWLVDPHLSLGGAGGPSYAPRIDFEGPGASVMVTAKAGAKVYQYASTDAPEVASPFVEGEQFESGVLILGADKSWWWLGTHDGRVKVSDTVSPKVKLP